MQRILGISAYFHDSAAALLDNGRIIAAAQEERFSRRKNDERFPRNAVSFCLKHAGLAASDIDAVVFYDKPIVKLARLLESCLAVAPCGWMNFPQALPSWLGEKLDLRGTLSYEMPELRNDCPVLFSEHHQAHAASAFFPSPFDEAALLTVDGVGEWATTSIGRGSGSSLDLIEELRFPHSLGLLYSAFTTYCGFRINSGEYKLMGLAPYGEPTYASTILDEIVEVYSDGSLRLNMEYFGFLHGRRMTNRRFHKVFGGPPRLPDSPIEQRHMDLAASIQQVTGDIMLRLARRARDVTQSTRLCLAGGVALNCVANSRILRERIFDNIWIQPAAGDAGGALGAALALWHLGSDGRGGMPRQPVKPDAMQGAFLGPAFTKCEIAAALNSHGAVYDELDETSLVERVARLLAEGRIIGWFQGRMEFGPRALGHRSILADPRALEMQSTLNQRIKFRESFRPFAPSVTTEAAASFFELDEPSPYMLLVAQVRSACRPAAAAEARGGLERLREVRSEIPAVTHVDGSARVQTVSAEQDPLFHKLLTRFESITGCPVLVNTSFNVRGEPVVCTPDDAYRCFVHTGMDFLAIGNHLLERTRQPEHPVAPTFDPIPD